MGRRIRLAFVIQRYGEMITGGAEQLCRHIVEHLTGDYDIDVLTTTARDYTSWRNYYVPGRERIGRLNIRRFPVEAEYSRHRFRWRTRLLFRLPHSDRQEIRWIESQGPYCPALIKFISDHRDDYDLFVFFSYRYYPSYFGISLVGQKSILVPTAEHDDTIYLRTYRRMFSKPRGIIYLSPEEKALIERVSSNHHVPNATIGIGIDVPATLSVEKTREKYMLTTPYLLYVGRIDENKGCSTLFDYMLRFFERHPDSPYRLVLAGNRAMGIPRHPRIQYLGYVDEHDKFSIIRGCDIMIMPSRYESLSIVTLEGMAVGKPLLVSEHCEVLAGHCRRSGAALSYRDYEGFEKQLLRLAADAELRGEMGERGKQYVRSNYNWPDVERHYREFIESLLVRPPGEGEPGVESAAMGVANGGERGSPHGSHE